MAIHEAMEQQTISICKAGVKATLNSRTSVLAAANPIGGRYDRTKSLRQNISLSAPIMSRFDLFFVLVDEQNEVTDYAIARKIVDLHSVGSGESAVTRPYELEDVLKYLLFCKLFKPKMSEDATEFVVQGTGYSRTICKRFKIIQRRADASVSTVKYAHLFVRIGICQADIAN